MKKNFSIVICIVMIALCLTSCFAFEDKNENSDLNMQYALDSHQYCLFMNKQINPITNQLSTNMIIADSYIDGSADVEICVADAKQSLSIIKSCREEIEIMTPPTQYEDSYERTIAAIKETETVFEEYIEELEKEKTNISKIEECIDRMQVHFVSLTSEFNAYYE